MDFNSNYINIKILFLYLHNAIVENETEEFDFYLPVFIQLFPRISMRELVNKYVILLSYIYHFKRLNADSESIYCLFIIQINILVLL